MLFTVYSLYLCPYLTILLVYISLLIVYSSLGDYMEMKQNFGVKSSKAPRCLQPQVTTSMYEYLGYCGALVPLPGNRSSENQFHFIAGNVATRWLVAKSGRNGNKESCKPQRLPSCWRAFKRRSYPATVRVPAKLARSHLSKVIFTLSVVNEIHMDGGGYTPTISALAKCLKAKRAEKKS